MTSQTQDLLSRAMLVKLSISSWSARKYDKKVTAETNKAHGADADAGRYNKKLLPGDAPEYKELTSHISAMRNDHYANTLPWSDEGWRVLTIDNYDRYMDKMRNGQHKFDSLCSLFFSAYPRQRDGARVALNGMYNPDDYPDDISKRYDWDIDVKPIPAGTDFRVALSESEMQQLTAHVEQRTREALVSAQEGAVKRLYDVVAKIYAKLTETRVTKDRVIKARATKKDKYDSTGKLIPAGTVIPGRVVPGGQQKDGIYRDTLLENAREVCEALKYINLTQDARLETLRREVELMATATSEETLRDVPEVRIETANRAQSILDAMTSTYGKSVFGGK